MGAAAILPAPTAPAEQQGGVVELRGADGVFGPTEEHSLRAELRVHATGGAELRFEFQVFAQASGVRMWMEQDTAGAASTPATTDPLAVSVPRLDTLERLRLRQPHLRLIQVTLKDQTDDVNEVALETEWLLHPNETAINLRGNLFALEDVLHGNGLVFLKEAPQPDIRPVGSPRDAWFSGTGMTKRTGKAGAYSSAYDLAFLGSGFTGSGSGYRYSLFAYQGGEAGRIAALHTYQRQIRTYDPRRDGLLLSNTWGDRAGSTKISEAFVRREIDGGRAIGVDVVQVDDGWETGKTLSSYPDGGGLWESYWNHPNFWTPDPKRFPHTLSSVAEYAHNQGIGLGLWYGPDSSSDFSHWQDDERRILQFHNESHVDTFKLDSVKLRTKLGETRYRELQDGLQRQTGGNLLLDVDVTAETRQGYFGNIAVGPLFVENRYTDWHGYWPHQTLRNLWKLSHYVDPIRLRMEFLNSERHTELYPGDPLAPVHYDPACMFAITMMSSPLAWFETSGLSPRYASAITPLIATWKQHREAMYRGTTLPIGDVPDGVHWTGFVSRDAKGDGYLLLFRELNRSSDWILPDSIFPSGITQASVLGGNGTVQQGTDGHWRAHIDKELGFVWAKVSGAGGTSARN